MEDLSTKVPVIRKLTYKNLDRVVEIDAKILGKQRQDYWEAKLYRVEETSHISPLVAEVEGRMIGFVIGYASGWEYGVSDNVGWIDTIGVDPDFQRRGIGKMLMKEMIYYLKKVGVDKVYVLVNWRDGNLMRFLDSMGFQRGDMLNMELKI